MSDRDRDILSAPLPPELRAAALNIEPEPTVGLWSFSFVINCPCGGSFLWQGQPDPKLGEAGTILTHACGRSFRVAAMPHYKDGVIQVSLLHGLKKKT